MKALISAIGLLLLGAFLIATQSGCLLFAGAAAGVAGVFYDKGDLTGYVDADVRRTTAATKLAMGDMGFPVITSYSDTEEGKVEARVGSDNKAVVHVNRKSDTVSKINIRIGTFGDESLSRQILAKTEQRLKDPNVRVSANAP